VPNKSPPQRAEIIWIMSHINVRVDLGLHVKIENRSMYDLSELREGNAVHAVNHGCDDGTMTYMSKLSKAHAV
jgi:hypothetical protein